MTRDRDWAALAARIQAWGRDLGFESVGVAGVDLAADEVRLLNWLDAGRHGEMDYMARHGARRARPAELVPGTLSVITARLNYTPEDARDADEVLADPDLAFVSFDRWPRGKPVLGTNAWEVVPNLAIEVISPANGAHVVIEKIDDYFASSVERVWVI